VTSAIVCTASGVVGGWVGGEGSKRDERVGEEIWWRNIKLRKRGISVISHNGSTLFVDFLRKRQKMQSIHPNSIHANPVVKHALGVLWCDLIYSWYFAARSDWPSCFPTRSYWPWCFLARSNCSFQFPASF
jgi:hypothetical protein